MSDEVQNIDSYDRYCPGEERIKISEAICLGRRRSNFPKCKGCQFNDDEREAQDAAGGRSASGRDATATSADDIDSVFRGDAIVGRHPAPLDREVAWRIGQASAQFLRSTLRGYLVDHRGTPASPRKIAAMMRLDEGDVSKALRLLSSVIPL